MRAVVRILILPMLLVACAVDDAPLILVKDHAATSVILVARDAESSVRQAAEELQQYVEKSTGARLEIRDDAGWESEQLARIHVGSGAYTKSIGLNVEDIPPERFRIVGQGRDLVLLGHDVNNSPATYWAVMEFLERYIGARWLWPGDLGTLVPSHASLVLEKTVDISGGPELQQRRLRYRHDEPDTQQWLRRQRMGSRMRYNFGHSFTEWWERYKDVQPELFAEAPAGISQPWPQPDRVKLSIGNPAVADRIMAEWNEAGRPDNWAVCPNDGSGWCICADCRALDPPGHQSYSDEDIFRARVDLSQRFFTFWNRLLRRMKQDNPEIKLSTYAYAVYREPPADVQLEPGFVMGLVHSYNAYDNWSAWNQAGAELILRPNWWHMGAIAPHLPLHAAGDFFKFAAEKSMIGFDFDSLLGFWATQGPYYYLIARLSVRQDMSVDEVIDEWCSAFGSAAATVRAYIDYWEEITLRAAYTIPAGGAVSQNPDGLYETAARTYDFSPHPLSGSWRVIPHIYTDEVCDPARRLLARAVEQVIGDAPIVRDRIAWLQDGLQHLVQTRDILSMAYDNRSISGPEREQFARAVMKLEEWRVDLNRRHVVDVPIIHANTRSRNIRTAPKDFDMQEGSLEGL